MDTFLKHWFGGFEIAISQIDDNAKAAILMQCGKACSDSYSKQVYIDAKRDADNDEAFFAALKKTFAEIDIETKEKEHRYEFRYGFCACDLVKQGYVTTPLLCECSRNSLLTNLESVWGEGCVGVSLIESILTGASCCRFLVTRKQR